MSMLQHLAESVTIPPGHTYQDLISYTLLLILAGLKAVEMARAWGIIPDKGSADGVVSARNVGAMHVDSLKSIIRHQMADVINPLMVKVSEYNSKQLGQLEEVNRNLIKMITILEERKR